jgi:peptidoglycan/LPS O-acetylase OafA/YrhL
MTPGCSSIRWSCCSERVRSPHLGALVTLVSLGKCALQKPRRKISYKEIWIILLWGVVATYVLALSLGTKKVDRYILPALLAIDLLGGIGLVSLYFWSRRRWKTDKARLGLGLGLCLIVILQAVLCLSYYPYYFSYYSPVLGGGKTAQTVMLVGWGEGFDQIVEYLNKKANAENIVLATTHDSILDFREFKGNLSKFPSPLEQ